MQLKKELSPPVIVAVIVVLALIIIGVAVYSSGGPGEGKTPGPNAGGIRTAGGKILPTAAGNGGSSTDNSSGQSGQSSAGTSGSQ